jgi:hypothetical protein
MQNSGFGGHAGRDERQVRSAKKPAAAATPWVAVRKRTPKQRAGAEQDVEQAKATAEEAIAARQASYDLLETADQTVTDTAGRVERARRELDEALKAQVEARKDRRGARAAFDRADHGARDAQRHLADATRRLDRLAP